MQWFEFSTILTIIVIMSGLIWAVDAWFLAPRRQLVAGSDYSSGAEGAERVQVARPVLVEYARSFFPVLLVVLLIRTFVFEPFRIPSGSMMPTLLAGDFIAVNKYSYGLRLPVTNQEVVDLGASPARGDVVVFRYPGDGHTAYIKRIVGVPGDRIRYGRDKRLFVNGEAVPQEGATTYAGTGAGSDMTGARLRVETLGERSYETLDWPGHPSVLPAGNEWEVPDGHYFVMGDNRDRSYDSRFWGFVPEENIVGRASVIWLHWNWGHGLDVDRIGDSIH